MCFPGAGLALTASQSFYTTMALSALQAVQQYSASAASVRAANDAAKANQAQAVQSASSRYVSIASGLLQEEDAATSEIERIEGEGQVAAASATLAGIEAGAGGAALSERPDSFRASALRYSSAVTRSLAYKRTAAAGDLNSVADQTAGRISGYRPEHTEPSLLNAGFTLLGGYLQGQKFLAPAGGGGALRFPNGIRMPSQNISLPIFN